MQVSQPPPSKDWAHFRPCVLAGVTQMNAHFTSHAFERHSHETYSIGLTASGVQTFHCRGSLHASLPGDVILFNPDEPHDGQRGTQEGFGYSMLYVSSEVIADCRDKEAHGDIATCFRQPLVRDPELSAALTKAIAAVSQPQESLREEELMRYALVRLLQRYGEKQTSGYRLKPTAVAMGRVRDYLQSHFAEDITVDGLAKEAGLSRSHLTRAFAQQFGVPPHIYLNTVRIERAKSAMLAGSSLVDTAIACGFADQSHFNRRFKGSVGLSPGAWVQQMSTVKSR